MEKIISYLQGKKTYFLAAALLAYAIGGYFSGHLSGEEAIGLIYSSGVLSSLRAAITKSTPTQPTISLKDISDLPERETVNPGETVRF